MGSDRLLFTLLAEEAIGLTAKTSAELKARKDMFWKEIDFVISDLALEVGVRVFSFTWRRSRRLVHFFAARARAFRCFAPFPLELMCFVRPSQPVQCINAGCR